MFEVFFVKYFTEIDSVRSRLNYITFHSQSEKAVKFHCIFFTNREWLIFYIDDSIYQIWMGIDKHSVFRPHDYVLAYQATVYVVVTWMEKLSEKIKLCNFQTYILTGDRFVDTFIFRNVKVKNQTLVDMLFKRKKSVMCKCKSLIREF